jgi:MFS family permease
MTDSPQAWWRLVVALIICTIGGVGMWSVVVALPAVQAEFGLARADASIPYTLTMAGYSLGGVAMGRLADRFGVAMPILFGTVALGLGYLGAGMATNVWQFALAQGVLVAALGSSATFGPLMADTSLWFVKRRGIAVAICASGNYIAGTIWPPVITHFIETVGWRTTHIGIGAFCVATMLPLALLLRRRPPVQAIAADAAAVAARGAATGISPGMLQTVLVVAGLSCCVAMSMPQVHIVAYCGDLGYGVARGAEMLSLMLGCGVISRLASGLIADRIGGIQTLLLGSFLQTVALGLYLISDGLTSLYVVSALFGLFQGGIVPSYAIVARSLFPAAEAGARVGTVLMATIAGMAIGGWLSGAIFDLTGSYRAAFLNGIAWNLVNVAVMGMLLLRVRRLTRKYA